MGVGAVRNASDPGTGGPASRVSVIVCAYNEERYLGACLDALAAQTRPPHEIVVVNNASTDDTATVARRPGVTVVDEPAKGLVKARATGARAASADMLAFLDADCRASVTWLEDMTALLELRPRVVAASASYRYYDWHLFGRALIRTYDMTVAPLTHVLVQDVLKRGAILYGGNFIVRRSALDRIGGFDTTIAFHGEDTNLGRRLAAIGRVAIHPRAYVLTSARRFRAMGTAAVLRLYARNFWSEVLRHRPADRDYLDVRP